MALARDEQHICLIIITVPPEQQKPTDSMGIPISTHKIQSLSNNSNASKTIEKMTVKVCDEFVISCKSSDSQLNPVVDVDQQQHFADFDGTLLHHSLFDLGSSFSSRNNDFDHDDLSSAGSLDCHEEEVEDDPLWHDIDSLPATSSRNPRRSRRPTRQRIEELRQEAEAAMRLLATAIAEREERAARGSLETLRRLRNTYTEDREEQEDESDFENAIDDSLRLNVRRLPRTAIRRGRRFDGNGTVHENDVDKDYGFVGDISEEMYIVNLNDTIQSAA